MTSLCRNPATSAIPGGRHTRQGQKYNSPPSSPSYFLGPIQSQLEQAFLFLNSYQFDFQVLSLNFFEVPESRAVVLSFAIEMADCVLFQCFGLCGVELNLVVVTPLVAVNYSMIIRLWLSSSGISLI
jgi:hypothetical protein